MSLFRKEALAHKQIGIMGDVILIRPLSFYILTALVGLFSILLIILVIFGKYADKATVKGAIFPDFGIIKVYAPRLGTITSVDVTDGESVQEGQALFTITTERSLMDGGNVDSLIIKELQASRDNQINELQNIQADYALQEEHLQNRLKNLEEEIVNLNAQIATQEIIFRSSKERNDKEKILVEMGHLSHEEYKRNYETVIAQQGKLEGLQGHAIAKRSEVEQINTELKKLPLKKITSIAQVEHAISELKQKILSIEGGQTQTIFSPVKGRISALQIKKGMTDKEGVPLLSILPEGANLQAEVYIPTRAIGLVTVGQKVRIRYDAFPYQKYGIYDGTVIEVARTISTPQELGALKVVDLREPVYRVIVKLSSQSVNAYGKELMLQAGMSLEADVMLGERTILQKWFLDPLYKFKGSI